MFRTLHLGLLNLKTFTGAHFSSLSKTLLRFVCLFVCLLFVFVYVEFFHVSKIVFAANIRHCVELVFLEIAVCKLSKFHLEEVGLIPCKGCQGFWLLSLSHPCRALKVYSQVCLPKYSGTEQSLLKGNSIRFLFIPYKLLSQHLLACCFPVEISLSRWKAPQKWSHSK